nr:hypothetical protein [Deltaproteobacteria bacterium]
IQYKGRGGSGELDIALGGNPRITEGRTTRTRAELVIDGADVDARLERKLDVTQFGSPVRSVTTTRDPRVANRVVVSIELLVPSTLALQRTATGVRWQVRENAIW